MSVGTDRQRAIDYDLPVGRRVSVLVVGGGAKVVGELDDVVFDDNGQVFALLMSQGHPTTEQTLVAWQAVVTVDVVEDYISGDLAR
jgi:hypothetical protein